MSTTKPAWYYVQSGVVPYIVKDEEIKILLITSRSGKRWIVPKGIIEPGMTAVESARKEALEEAGILGTIDPEPAGCYSYEKWGGTCMVTVFIMEITTIMDTWDEEWMRTRELVTWAEALKRIDQPALQRIIKTLRDGRTDVDTE